MGLSGQFPLICPYANLFILNIAQAIIAVFLSSEFIKRDRKQDTTEVFYARSMSNGAYLWGKTISILSIFLVINFAVLAMGLIFNLLAENTSVEWQAYLYYPLLISFPTLLYIIGLACLMMSIIRNQALTFVLLIGYILASLIYIKSSYNYLFDYMAFYLPLFHSDITGFTDWPTIVRLRSMYACLGLGFIFFSILFLKRLPQSRLMNISSLVLGLAFTSFALFLGYQHWLDYQKKSNLPGQMIALNNQYLQHGRIDVEAHEIEFEQEKYGFSAISKINGMAKTASKEFVFTLNPGLKVNSVSAGTKQIDFDRKLHLLFIKTDTILKEGAEINWTINYSGTIDEDACFPDIDLKQKYRRPDRYVFDIGRRYAFNQPEYLHLLQRLDGIHKQEWVIVILLPFGIAKILSISS